MSWPKSENKWMQITSAVFLKCWVRLLRHFKWGNGMLCKAWGLYYGWGWLSGTSFLGCEISTGGCQVFIWLWTLLSSGWKWTGYCLGNIVSGYVPSLRYNVMSAIRKYVQYNERKWFPHKACTTPSMSDISLCYHSHSSHSPSHHANGLCPQPQGRAMTLRGCALILWFN